MSHSRFPFVVFVTLVLPISGAASADHTVTRPLGDL